jgi:hypothetical protein
VAGHENVLGVTDPYPTVALEGLTHDRPFQTLAFSLERVLRSSRVMSAMGQS